MKEKRLLRIKKVLFVLTLFLAFVSISYMIKNGKADPKEIVFRAVQYIAMILVLEAPRLLHKYFKLEVPLPLAIIIALFAFNALVLGDGLDFYGKYPWWDSVLHFHSGIILSFVSLWVIHIIMAGNGKYIYFNRLFLSLFIILFSTGVGAIWEICEYTCDEYFHTNTQQYMKTTRGSIVGKKDIPLEGHDALGDTMKDLILDFGGGLIVAVYGFVEHDKFIINRIKDE